VINFSPLTYSSSMPESPSIFTSRASVRSDTTTIRRTQRRLTLLAKRGIRQVKYVGCKAHTLRGVPKTSITESSDLTSALRADADKKTRHLFARENATVAPNDTERYKITFFDLPYELREMVYVYAFTSSKIHNVQRNRNSSWQCLALTSRSIKHEIDTLLMQRLTLPITATWANSGATYPMFVESSSNDQSTQRLVVQVPRSALHRSQAQHVPLLLQLLSTVLSFPTQRTTITMYNDGTRAIRPGEMADILPSMLMLLFLRNFSNEPYYQRYNVTNAKEVAILWSGHLDDNVGWRAALLDPRTYIVGLSRIPVRYIWPGWHQPINTMATIQRARVHEGFVVISETGFRHRKLPRYMKTETILPHVFRERYLSM
jgi:hypothetical protein